MGYQCPTCRQDSMVQAALGNAPILRCMSCDGYLVNYKILSQQWENKQRFWPTFSKMIQSDQGRCHFCGHDMEAGQTACPKCKYHLSLECPSHGLMLGATIGKLQVDYCPHCRDVWMDAGELVELAVMNHWQIWDGTGTPPEGAAKALKRQGTMGAVNNFVEAIMSPLNKLFG